MNLGPLPGGQPVDAATWAQASRRVIAKAITEYAYEEGFAPGALNRQETRWELRLGESLSYRFDALRRIWGQLSIQPESLLRIESGRIAPAQDAVQFMVDAREALAIEPDTLCIYARELYNTLLADVRIATHTDATDAHDLLDMADVFVQQLLDGHPKAPANKGRIGWGLSDFEAYAPEFQARGQLFWVAADRSACHLAIGTALDEDALLAASMDAAERGRLAGLCREKGVDPATHRLMPVHPWQWDNMIVTQFAGEIAAGRLVPLGLFGDAYLPQQSLRTLANADRPQAFHIKLPLTILNTSAWRGVPGRYMAIGAAFSGWLVEKTESDPVLKRTIVLREVAGAFYPHPIYEQVEGAPYQFREMLGAIWRESPEARMSPRQNALMMGALTRLDGKGRPLVSALIAQSGLSTADWLERLFDAVTVPLYHFLCRYGVGFIAHGQNVTLIIENGTPVGVALKDLQGDVDLIDEDFAELGDMPADVHSTLQKRPAAHLIHHVQTGHFASVLRFLSDCMAEQSQLQEIEFYAVLTGCLRRYQRAHPDLKRRFALFDLFTPGMARICINRVRLAVGYGDANRRPVPSLGTELVNPLYLAEQALSPATPALSGDQG